jgi:hypothetical protein
MLKLLSNLNLMQRIEISISDWDAVETADFRQGSWVELDGTVSISGLTGFPIWTESNRDNTYGWTPDVGAGVTGGTNKLTVLGGFHRAITDQFEPAGVVAGSPLTTSATGKLRLGVVGDDHIVAVAQTVATDYVYLGTTYSNVVTYVTV